MIAAGSASGLDLRRRPVPVRPVSTALWEEMSLGASVLGPVDFSALARFAASCASGMVEEGDAVDAGAAACMVRRAAARR